VGGELDLKRRARDSGNELLFRTVNQQIARRTERFRAQFSDIDIVCECADPACVGTIRIAIEEFAKIERATNTFLVLPGHEEVGGEDVVEKTVAYFVVRKKRQARRNIRAR
jgi:hypothetical protein